jgi:hypothetical protein
MKAAARRDRSNERGLIRMGPRLPDYLKKNPLKVETKYASAGPVAMKNGIRIFFKVRF